MIIEASKLLEMAVNGEDFSTLVIVEVDVELFCLLSPAGGVSLVTRFECEWEWSVLHMATLIMDHLLKTCCI